MLRLLRLRLSEFRSWAALDAAFPAKLTLIVGENGSGKTNLLEAISLLGPGRGLRGARLGELGRRSGSQSRAWAVAGRFAQGTEVFDLGTGTAAEGGGERRLVRLNGEALPSQSALADRIAMVWLTPQMERLFQEGPGGRRRFLDRLVWALEPSHARQLAAFDNAMAQRNRLLLAGRADPRWLAALEEAMARHAVAVTAARLALVKRLNAAMGAAAVAPFPAAELQLLCPLAAALAGQPALAVEEALREGLASDRGRDAAAAMAARGAHRADWRLLHGPTGQEAGLCSTGEQKALLIAMVVAHAALITEARGFAPLLLFDEVAAHLDEARRESLFAVLSRLPAQVFLTGTDAAPFRSLAGQAALFRAGGGVLREMAWPASRQGVKQSIVSKRFPSLFAEE